MQRAALAAVRVRLRVWSVWLRSRPSSATILLWVHLHTITKGSPGPPGSRLQCTKPRDQSESTDRLTLIETHKQTATRRPAACRAALQPQQQPQLQQQLRANLGCRLGLGLAQQPQRPQWRGLATGGKGPEDADSHDDFKPQRKAPPADLDGAVQMIEEQVRVWVWGYV